MSAQIPVTVVGGYLGAGKTSLVNHVLREAQGIRIAVLVNDFGALPIDADLVEAREADLISIAGGCVCCSFGSDLMEALMALSTRSPPPEHVLIETSGVALPASVARAAALLPRFLSRGVVVLADAESVRERAGDRYTGDTIARQLHDANLLIMNKTDLLSALEIEQLRAWLARAAPRASRIEAVRARVPVELLLGPGRSWHPAAASSAPASGAIPAEGASARYASESFTPSGPVDVEMLARGLAQGVPGMIRAKGVLQDLDGSMKALQVVGARWEISAFVASARAGSALVCIGLRGRMERGGIERILECARRASTTI